MGVFAPETPKFARYFALSYITVLNRDRVAILLTQGGQRKMALNQQPFAVAVLEHRSHVHGEFKCPPASLPLPRFLAGTQHDDIPL